MIPTLNEAPVIASAIGHAWRLDPHEVIVSDGGSDDGTPRLAAEAGAVVLHGPPGRGAQLSTGAAGATGDVLLLLHADTWLAPEGATQLRRAAERGVAWGAFRQAIDDPGRRFRWLEWGNAARVRWMRLPYGDQAMFINRRLYLQVGGFAGMPLMEDVELSRRLSRIARPALLPGPLHVSARRWQRQGVVRQTAKNWTLVALWRCGVPPATLARWYRPHSPRVPGNREADPRLETGPSS
ncbi:MAG: TIGR04283 family arsenosugar biosynthesis glycosyltransferase [Planctomycetota bacterium]